MLARPDRTASLILAALLLAPGLFAAEIKLKSGSVYSNAKILHQDAHSVEIQVQFGVINVPIANIESIDGVLIGQAPKTPAPTNLPPPEMAPPGEEPPAGAVAEPGKKPKPESKEPLVTAQHKWTMDLFLLGLGVAAWLWLAMLLWIQKDADERYTDSSDEAKKWNSIALLLPGIGFLLYLIRRMKDLREEAVAVAAAEQAAAGLDIAEPQQKRGLFGGRAKVKATTKKKQRIGFEFLDEDGNPIEIRKDLPEMTGIEAAREVLEEAIMDRASDVHVEPHEKEYKVRFRVDGLLQERLIFEKTDGTRVVSALKTLAQIDVAEKRKAQDGRFRVRTGVRDVDFRVATAASIYGEKMVLRILDRKGGRLDLSDLGMKTEMLEEFNKVIHSRNGIILATGPTGSGKTSTLYAALSQLDHNRLNIMTIEDPVEYELEGATQIPVNVKAGVTYESGLRSILRQDPDVILVGEMRDSEAATIAVRAALTGHLVFSSLHTKDAISCVMRLADLGVERYQVSSAMLLVVAQRLVRVLCNECREPYKAKGDELKEIGLTLPAGAMIYRAKGCEACDRTGYQGRSGIFELLIFDEDLRRAINEGTSQQAQFDMVRKKGFRPYREDGVDKVLAGVTTVEEIIQAS